MLLGICDSELASREVQKAGKLILLKSKFGTGYLFRVRVRQGNDGPKLTKQALKARINTFIPIN